MKLFVVILLCLCFWMSSIASAQPVQKTVFVGVPVNFTCQQSESDHPTFVWYLDREAIRVHQSWYMPYPPVAIGPTGSRVKSSVVQISPQKSFNGSLLACRIIVNGKHRDEEWMLTVIEARSPSINESECSQPVIEGRNCTLTCRVNDNTDLAWYIDDKRQQDGVTSTSSTSGATSVLYFITSRWHHRRIVRCKSIYPDLTETPQQQIILNVLYPPTLVSGKSTNQQNTTLWCEADSNPPSKVIWFDPQGTQIPTGDRIHTVTFQKDGITQGYGNVTRSELTLDKTNASNGGAYKCKALNEFGMVEASIELFESNGKQLFFMIGIPLLIVSIGCTWLTIAAICYTRKKQSKGEKEAEDGEDPTYSTTNPEGSHGLTRWLSSVSSRTSKVERPSQPKESRDISRRPRLSLPRVY
ncbi:cell adhesion molecule 2-like [Patiria miniata]|uniref:Ig-like domain-containing protein n=1 Tax=Patiria miniata TaxID=46514 RepID=A0A913ZPD7_PATMI|nr:cell adhesion molecule 2-like [Patiria miniata]